MDYCNTVLASAPRTVTDKSQWVLNAAARVITGTRKFDRGLGQILHDQLQWLDIPDRVLFKLAMRVHQCLNGRAPLYLSEHCIPVSNADVCIPPTVAYLPCRVSGSTLSAVGRSQLLARMPMPRALSLTLSGIPLTAQTVLGVYLKCTCSRDTSASSALGVLNDNALYKNPRTHSFRVLTHSRFTVHSISRIFSALTLAEPGKFRDFSLAATSRLT